MEYLKAGIRVKNWNNPHRDCQCFRKKEVNYRKLNHCNACGKIANYGTSLVTRMDPMHRGVYMTTMCSSCDRIEGVFEVKKNDLYHIECYCDVKERMPMIKDEKTLEAIATVQDGICGCLGCFLAIFGGGRGNGRGYDQV